MYNNNSESEASVKTVIKQTNALSFINQIIQLLKAFNGFPR